MNALSKFLSKENEPVRLYLYSVGTAVLVLLGAVGVLTGSLVVALGGVLVAALMVPVASALRDKVSPVQVPSDVPPTDEILGD